MELHGEQRYEQIFILPVGAVSAVGGVLTLVKEIIMDAQGIRETKKDDSPKKGVGTCQDCGSGNIA
ncbi:hypothetical protein PTKIN_Ptkin05aG0061900 [Pterospermum kingtungense]